MHTFTRFSLFLTVISAGLTGCAVDNLEAVKPQDATETTAAPVAVQHRLRKIITPFAYRQFSYTSTLQLEGEEIMNADGSPASRVTIQEKAGNRIGVYTQRLVRPVAPWDHGFRQEFAYASDGRLFSIHTYQLSQGGSPDLPNSQLSSVDTLVYNASGQVISQRSYSYRMQGRTFSIKPVQKITTQYQYDKKGNLVEEQSVSAPIIAWGGINRATRTVYDYDNKDNPYHLDPSPIFGRIAWSPNNVTRSAFYSVELNTLGETPNFNGVQPTEMDYKYSYKDKLPTLKTLKHSQEPLEQYEYSTY